MSPRTILALPWLAAADICRAIGYSISGRDLRPPPRRPCPTG